MVDIIGSVIFILLIMIGFPVLILILRDRGGCIGFIIEKGLGLTILLLGLLFFGISFYIYFIEGAPKAEWLIAIPRFLFSIGLIYTGCLFLCPKLLINNSDIIEWEYWDSKDIQEATNQALEQIPMFLEHLDNSINECYIRFVFKSNYPDTEYAWALVHSFNDDVFTVSIESILTIHDEELEDFYHVKVEDIKDWKIIAPSGFINGGFTILGFYRYLEKNDHKLTRAMKDNRFLFINNDE